MHFLTRSEILSFVPALLLAGCATSYYRVANVDLGRHELSVSPDRIVMECEDVSENREIPYGFMIHVLDDENTVVDVTQTNTLSQEACFDRIKKIGRIIKTGNQIYIGGVGDLESAKVVEKWTHEFPGHGTFHSNGRFLQFMAIANENGLCYGAYSADDRPCPNGVDFPIRDKR